MSNNHKGHDPFQPLRHFYNLVEAKCDELPADISNWIKMAEQHDSESRTYKNIIQSSVNPREEYAKVLKQVKVKISEIFEVLEGKTSVDFPEINLEMPLETILRKYASFTDELKNMSKENQSFNSFFNELMELILYIRSDLSQSILRCSKGDVNFKEVEHHLKVLEPDLESIMEEHILHKKGHLNAFTEQLIQKIELDVSVRQSIQDRLVMHSTLKTYLNQLEANDDFAMLVPTLQHQIRQIVSRPLDNILSEQQVEVDIAEHELSQLLEPVNGKASIKIPNSAASVHQLLQQAVQKTEEMNRLKVNVMGAFKHLVTQVDQLFQFNPLPPVQAASVLGAAWMQHPMTSADHIREFKDHLSLIKKSDSYVKLTQYIGEGRVDESFRFVDGKMNELAEHLELNTRIESMSSNEELPALVNATDIAVKGKSLDPHRVRREIMGRSKYLTTVKTYIQQLSDSVRAHLLLVYYEHSLKPEKVNLSARTNEVLNQISMEFYERKNSDEAINKGVFMNAVRSVFDDMCDTEMEKNREVFEIRKQIKSLVKTLKLTNPLARNSIKKKLMLERKQLKLKLIQINAPRLKQFIETLSNKTYEQIHTNSMGKLDSLKERLNILVQEKLAIEHINLM